MGVGGHPSEIVELVFSIFVVVEVAFADANIDVENGMLFCVQVIVGRLDSTPSIPEV